MQDLNPLLDALAGRGWHVQPDFLPVQTVTALRSECLARQAAGRFRTAGVGRDRLLGAIRGDQILWLEADDASPAVQAYLAAMEGLRLAANRELQLGLFELECHFAAYPPGAGYQRHLDRLRGDDRRTLSVILYLNEDWRPEDGGALRFWPEPGGEPLDIPPLDNTLVAFLSERFWHAVLPARRQRLALTGWFRRR